MRKQKSSLDVEQTVGDGDHDARCSAIQPRRLINIALKDTDC
jgi:hypothetical protein